MIVREFKLDSNRMIGDEAALAYWRENRQKYPPRKVWHIFEQDLCYKSFATRVDLLNWCRDKLNQLKDPVYLEEQRKKKEEEERQKMLDLEAERERTRNERNSWQKHRPEVGTSFTWPPPRPEQGSFPFFLSLYVWSFIKYVVSITRFCVSVVPDEELDIDSLEGFEGRYPSQFPKPEGPHPTCFCGDTCKMDVSANYKTLWQRYWMCPNLDYDPEPGQTEVLYESCELFNYVFFTSIC